MAVTDTAKTTNGSGDRLGLWLFLFAVAVRFVALPFATQDSADSPARVFIGWLWSEQPYYIAAGGWGPLHYYLVGAAMALWPEPVWSPALLHILFGGLASVFMYRLALEMFRSPRAALLAGVGFAMYPIAIAGSLEAHAELPCLAFLLFGLRYLVRASRPEGTVRDALIAGVGITLASALRYEVWMILPFLLLPLLPQWRKVFACAATSLVHPVIWMIGCTVRFGNPLYSFVWSDAYEREIMNHAIEPVVHLLLRKTLELTNTTAHGLSVPLALLLAAGIVFALLRRPRECLWLLPAAWLFALMIYAGARGSLWYKPSYTLIFGTLALPYLAAPFQRLRVEAWPIGRYALLVCALVAGIGVTTIRPLWARIPHGGFFETQAAGHFQVQDEAKKLLGLINDGKPVGRSPLVMDFIGWEPTGYLSSHTRVHPQSLCTPTGTPVPVDIPATQRFLLEHREGTFLAYDKGKLTAELHMESPDTGVLAGVRLQFSQSRRLPWADPPSGQPPGEVTVSKYRVIGEPAERDTRPAQCTTPCPVSLCSI